VIDVGAMLPLAAAVSNATDALLSPSLPSIDFNFFIVLNFCFCQFPNHIKLWVNVLQVVRDALANS
jgi:hypothetical protein